MSFVLGHELVKNCGFVQNYPYARIFVDGAYLFPVVPLIHRGKGKQLLEWTPGQPRAPPDVTAANPAGTWNRESHRIFKPQVLTFFVPKKL